MKINMHTLDLFFGFILITYYMVFIPVVIAAPVNDIQPEWLYNPCGGIYNVEENFTPSKEELEEMRNMFLNSITMQLKQCKDQIEDKNLDKYYSDFKDIKIENIGSEWIPNKESTSKLFTEEDLSNLKTYPNQLLALHTDLQKFAIAFELLLRDEENRSLKIDLSSGLKEYLKAALASFLDVCTKASSVIGDSSFSYQSPITSLCASIEELRECLKKFHTENETSQEQILRPWLGNLTLFCEVDSAIFASENKVPVNQVVNASSTIPPKEAKAAKDDLSRRLRNYGYFIRYKEFVETLFNVFSKTISKIQNMNTNLS